MATLPDEDRFDLWAEWMRENTEPCGITKPQLRAALDALDDFMHANQAAINNSIPQPARSTLSTQQKARLLMLVVQRRYFRGI